MLIKPINLDTARLVDFYQVMSLVITFLTNEDLATLNLAHEAEDFTTVFEIFDKALQEAKKTGYTNHLLTADDNLDTTTNEPNITIGFTGSLDKLTRFHDTEITEIAKILLAVFEKCGNGKSGLPHREETALITKI